MPDDDDDLRKRLIRLAHDHEDLRPHLLPLLDRTAGADRWQVAREDERVQSVVRAAVRRDLTNLRGVIAGAEARIKQVQSAFRAWDLDALDNMGVLDSDESHAVEAYLRELTPQGRRA